jgi:N-alpha-acetyltransferase 10/11
MDETVASEQVPGSMPWDARSRAAAVVSTPAGRTVDIYCIADVRSVIGRSSALPGGVIVRPIAETDIPALAEMYLRAYGPAAVGSPGDAVAEMRSAFDGTWGVLWPEASPAAWRGDELAGVVQSVRRPSMDDAPECPWLIEVFTDPRHRRAGIARALVAVACRAMEAAGESRVGLTVDDHNMAALALYRSLGFSEAT